MRRGCGRSVPRRQTLLSILFVMILLLSISPDVVVSESNTRIFEQHTLSSSSNSSSSPAFSMQQQQQGDDNNCTVLTCLISISEGSYLNDETPGEFYEEEHLVCIAINDETGRYGDDLSGVERILPENFRDEHELAIVKGELFLRLGGVTVKDGFVLARSENSSDVKNSDNTCNRNPWFERIINPAQQRHLQQDQQEQTPKDVASGSKTLAMVRVQTRDSEVIYSAHELETIVMNASDDRINVINQYRRMSFGQFDLQPVFVYDVFVDQNASSFDMPQNMYGPIEQALIARYGINEPSELADYVFYCYPPGLQRGFIAYTSRWHWRSVYSNKFCASLGATVHELGHQLGLGHSDSFSKGDYGDLSCYMSKGGGKVEFPQQSFNGQKNWLLGWFESRHLQVDPLTFEQYYNNDALLIDLATFVDFHKTTVDQPVIVAIREDYYLQYNCAKGFNAETRRNPDQVTVTADAGYASSLVNASLDTNQPLYMHSNYMESGRDLIIYVCEQIMGNELRPDVMRISIGLDAIACPRLNVPTVSPRPTSMPLAPTDQPSAYPTTSPRPSISAPPSSPPSMSKSPSVVPTAAPYSKVTHITPVFRSAIRLEEQLSVSHCGLLLLLLPLLLFLL